MTPAKLVPPRLPQVSMDTSRTRKIFLHPLSADSIAIEAREKPVKVEPIPAALPRKRGRLHKGKVRPAKTTHLERQTLGMNLEAMLADLPHASSPADLASNYHPASILSDEILQQDEDNDYRIRD